MQLHKQAILARNLDVRKTIALGGLFIKAGLDHFHPHDLDTLYGMLLDSKAKMEHNPTLQDQWRELGKELNENSEIK